MGRPIRTLGHQLRVRPGVEEGRARHLLHRDPQLAPRLAAGGNRRRAREREALRDVGLQDVRCHPLIPRLRVVEPYVFRLGGNRALPQDRVAHRRLHRVQRARVQGLRQVLCGYLEALFLELRARRQDCLRDLGVQDPLLHRPRGAREAAASPRGAPARRPREMRDVRNRT